VSLVPRVMAAREITVLLKQEKKQEVLCCVVVFGEWPPCSSNVYFTMSNAAETIRGREIHVRVGKDIAP
jgi:hypothetical protein